MIKEFLSSNILICDGAIGTYYSEITGNDISYCEFGNLNGKNTTEISTYIKQKKANSFILTQFAVKPDGFTRDGHSIYKIVSEVKK